MPATVLPADRKLSQLVAWNPVLDSGWDEMASAHPRFSVFHSAAWARVLAETYRYQPVYFATRGQEQPALLCCFQVDSWLTGRRGISLPFTDECELLASPECAASELFEAARKLGHEKRWNYFELRGAAGVQVETSVSFYSHSLDLTAGVEKLFTACDSSVRRAIRKAERSELVFQVGTSFEDVREYYDLHCLTRRKHGLPPQPFLFFQNICLHLLSKGLGFVASAKLRGRAVAAAVFLRFGNNAHYKFGASDFQFEDLRPNNFVMWNAIKHCAEAGLCRLEFGRTSLHNSGLRRYKLQWGAAESVLNYAKWDFAKTAFVPDTDRSSGFKNRIVRLLPLAASRLIGSLTYPHIA